MTPASVLRSATNPWNVFGANGLTGPKAIPPQTAGVQAAQAAQAAGSASPFQQMMAAVATVADGTSGSATSGAPPAGSPNGSSSATQGSITNAANSLASDQQTFLKLLTTQLKNQDPLSPMDTNAFTQQLVAMTGVQQQILSNQLLQSMVSNQSGLGNSVGIIGKEVKVSTAAATIQSGSAEWNYNLAAGASKVTFTIIDSQGKTVWQGDQSALSAGDHKFTWDGKDLAGVQRDDGGTYGLKVEGVAADGSPVSSTTWLQGTVTSLQQINGETIAIINGTQVPLSLIATVT